MSTQSERLDLLTNATATGNAKVAQIGGRFVFAINGTWNGATASLDVLAPDGTSYISVATYTANATGAFDVAQGATIRVSITGGPPAGMYATLVRVP